MDENPKKIINTKMKKLEKQYNYQQFVLKYLGYGLLTIAKAYELVSLAIENKENKKKGLLDPSQTWNHDCESTKEFAKSLVDLIDNDIECLKAIKKQLPAFTRCNHPKELHDRCDGKFYCMGCNEDL